MVNAEFSWFPRSAWEQHIPRLILLLCMLIGGCFGSLPQSVSHFEFLTPKPFGYVIGDEISHRIVVETRHNVELNVASLPKRGELNRWLTVNAVEFERSKTDGGLRYTLDIRYQIFYAPLEVKMLEIPGFSLQFKQGAQAIEQAVPSWHFTISPLRELAVRKDDGGEYMRPDAEPGRIFAAGVKQRLYLSLLVFFVSAAYLSHLFGYWPAWSRRGIFKRAERRLERLPEHDIASALIVLHQAFNTLNRKPLFEHRLDEFYRHSPGYRKLAEELNWFFALSNHYFFGGRSEVGSDECLRLRKLCHLCREVERGSR